MYSKNLILSSLWLSTDQLDSTETMKPYLKLRNLFSSNGSRTTGHFLKAIASLLNMTSRAKCLLCKSSLLDLMIKARTLFAPRIQSAKTKHRASSPFDRHRRSIRDPLSSPRNLLHWKSRHYLRPKKKCKRWNPRRLSSRLKTPVWRKAHQHYSQRRSSANLHQMWVFMHLTIQYLNYSILVSVCVAERR